MRTSNTEKLENERGREFVHKVLAGEDVTNADWFHYFANTKYCQTVPSYLDNKQRRVFVARLEPVLPDILCTYRAKDYLAICDAAERDFNERRQYL